MGGDPAIGAALAQDPDSIERIIASSGERIACRWEEIIAESTNNIIRWMVAIFLASTALVGAAVTTLILFLTGRL